MKHASTLANILLVATAYVLLTSSAFARCSSDGGIHTVGMTQVAQTLRLDRGTDCTVSRRPCPECAIQSATLTSRPAHGSVSQPSKFRFRYTPSKSYTGQDSFSVRWCERKPSDPRACYTVTYSTVVK